MDTVYSMLTEEEQEIKERLIKKYFGDTSEKAIIVKGMIETGEISESDAWKVFEELSNLGTGNFMGFLKELQRTLHCQIVRGTLLEKFDDDKIEEGAFDF